MSSVRSPKRQRQPDAGHPPFPQRCVMPGETPPIKKRAPTLYAIIGIKLVKGLLFVALAIVAYTLSDNDLPAEYRQLLHLLRLNPERRFFTDLAVQIGKITEANV